MTVSARDVATRATADIRVNDSYANLVLPRVIARAGLNSRDAADATSLTYGCARWRGFVDAVLAMVVDRPLNAVDGDVLDILRLGTFELLINDEPPHVVNEWVDIAKEHVPRATGFVNATLRKVSRSNGAQWRDSIDEDLSGDARVVALTSHPAWIIRSFDAILPEVEVDDLIEADNTPAIPTMVALPGLARLPEGVDGGLLSPYAFAAPIGNLSTTPGMSEGFVRVQDEGSQVAALLLAAVAPIETGEHLLDLCAGPGGKSALLAALLSEHEGTLTANEPHRHRADLVRTALKPFGEMVNVVSDDGREFGERTKRFSRVLVDAPCSGIGALRRRPEARWRKSEDDLVELTILQRQLLSSALNAVSVGGYVAYVTCSPDTRETVDVVAAVLESTPKAVAIDTASVLERLSPACEGVRRGSAVQLWPHRHNTDAMFIQLLQRTG